MMEMTREEMIEKLRAIDRDLRAVRDATDSPAIEACMREMEIQCHLARTYLGDVDSIFPEVQS